jgi:glycosyltransferase involved in cell wall biosynthesis
LSRGQSAACGVTEVRVALVTEIAAPYRFPVFNELNRMLDGGLHVYFTSAQGQRDWRVPFEEASFEYSVLGGFSFDIPYRGDRQPVYLAPPLLPRLARGRYDAVVVGGWSHLEAVWSLTWSRTTRRPLVLWSETPLLGPLPSRPLRSAWKRGIIRAAAAHAVPGPSTARYLEAHGTSRKRIFEAPNAVDIEFWGDGSRAPRPAPPVLLYAGRLVQSKGVDLALRAFGQSSMRDSWRLVVAGAGPEQARLAQIATSNVTFVGSQDREGLRALYRTASMLVFPSRYDPWGLVLNEAASSGLAAVASDAAGATRDLLRHEENGLIVTPDVDALRSAFDYLATDQKLADRLGDAAGGIARTHTPRACAEGLLAAVRAAASRA